MKELTEWWRWPLYDGKIITLTVTGGQVTRADLDVIRRHLDLMNDTVPAQDRGEQPVGEGEGR